MIVHICQVGFRLIAHVAFGLPSFRLFARIVKGGNSVDIVPTDIIDQRFDGTERAFMEDEVTRDYVYWTQENEHLVRGTLYTSDLVVCSRCLTMVILGFSNT